MAGTARSVRVRPFCIWVEDVVTHLQRLIELLRLEQSIGQQHRGMEGGLPVVKRVRTIQFVVYGIAA